jgi:hypothetical protein
MVGRLQGTFMTEGCFMSQVELAVEDYMQYAAERFLPIELSLSRQRERLAELRKKIVGWQKLFHEGYPVPDSDAWAFVHQLLQQHFNISHGHCRAFLAGYAFGVVPTIFSDSSQVLRRQDMVDQFLRHCDLRTGRVTISKDQAVGASQNVAQYALEILRLGHFEPQQEEVRAALRRYNIEIRRKKAESTTVTSALF